ncbi:MFS general substrate transporter [Dendrothele bispora CBS 962.96]|uniref:MFS general substrate transporter n=1 Tax=Dendrothele bispora (strain CBS 962.96) TaxID=1314807 RepID=A0A4S8LNV7_DENBC|nr:MFS general substrate transporter [Dendrothele bispora CBS 962.96]
MASITSRASVLWSEPDMDFDNDPENQSFDDDDAQDGRTRLDKTIDRIGMGSYQWTLLSLCGFGWMADNMWIQAIAIILPRVQEHYDVPDNYIGALSSSMFAGMMFGAVGWGTCSDLMGRSTAFNLTLFFTSTFGLLASLASSFNTLCIILFLLGSAVGGSMPTDGTLLLEHMPNGKQYLVTALSVFFSFGAVLAAVVALLVVPQHSCPRTNNGDGLLCDVDNQNQGWKYLLGTLGLITLSMFLARMVFFRLHESPRYLVHAGRHQEALESLQMISRFNGSDLELDLEDVDDERPKAGTVNVNNTSTTAAAASSSNDRGGGGGGGGESQPFLSRKSDDVEVAEYGFDENGGHDRQRSLGDGDGDGEEEDAYMHVSATTTTTTTRHHHPPRTTQMMRRQRSSVYEKRVCSALPRWLRKPLWAWWDRVMMVLTPEWMGTTVLVWGAWCGMSLAYTMFNVFLPKLLETGSSSPGTDQSGSHTKASLWDVVIFTIGGCPGAILGAWMVNSSLGRRWSLAGSTFITAFFCVVFVMVDSTWAIRATTVGISLSATTMWAVLYGWTPEIFGTEIRGTACGIASALSRVGGMIAPILGGVLLSIDRAVPVYTSVVVFCLAGVCVLLLREDAGEGARSGGAKVIVH